MTVPEPLGPDDKRAGKVAFVFAGGGAKGAFEAGAATYLVEEESVVPEVITATSAGALCAAVLAQARSHREMVERVRELHADLLAMTRGDLLFGKQPWVEALDGTLLGRAIEHWVVERTRPPLPRPSAPPGAAPLPAAQALSSEPGGAAVQHRAQAARRLRVLGQLLRALPSVGRAGRRVRGRTGSLLTLEPLAERLRRGGDGISPVDPALVARPGLELRLAVVALRAGRLRFVTGEGRIVSGDAVTPVEGLPGTPVDVLDAVVASASVPMVFPPRAMAGDAYVDGGIVENVPVAAAAALGARRIFALVAVPLDPEPDEEDYSRASAPVVLLRSVGEISFAERQRANLSPALPGGTELVVIDPLVDVVGPFDISQGLMCLCMDYGWLRAADVRAELDPETRRRAEQTTDAIVRSRTQAWHIEESLWRSGGDPGALAPLLAHKRAVRDALDERKGLGLPSPEQSASWWRGYELHDRPRPAGLPATPPLDDPR